MHLLDLAELVAWLPRDCALSRSIRGEEESFWGAQEMLLASVVDELRYLQYVTMRLKGVKDTKPPKPIPRPGVMDEDAVKHGDKAAALPIDEMAEWLGGAFASLNN